MAKSRYISGLRSLTREDMTTLLGPVRQSIITSPDRIRDSHHMVARYAAMGMRHAEIANVTGYSTQRVGVILRSPAMTELVANYREMVDDNYATSIKEEFDLGRAIWRKSKRLILDEVEAAEIGEVKIPLRELNALATDGEDRYGTSKKSTNINLNADYAAELEAAIARYAKAADSKVIEVEATPEGIRRRL